MPRDSEECRGPLLTLESSNVAGGGGGGGTAGGELAKMPTLSTMVHSTNLTGGHDGHDGDEQSLEHDDLGEQRGLWKNSRFNSEALARWGLLMMV